MDSLLDPQTASAIGIAFCSIFFFYYLYVHSSSKEAPIAQGAWPILGHLLLLRPSKGLPHKTLGELANKYGPLFTVKLGSKRALVLSSWKMAEECFTKIDLEISTRPKLDVTKHMAYNGAMYALAPYGLYWREARKITTSEILSHRSLEQLEYFRVMEVRRWIKELYNIWCNKENNNSSNYVMVEMEQLFAQLSTNIILPMLIGKRYFGATSVFDKEKAKKYVQNIKEMMRLVGVFTVGDALPLLKWFDFGGHVKAMKKTYKEMDKTLDEILEEHRRNKNTLSEKDVVDPGHQDFMDVMLSLLDGTIIDGFDSDTTIKGTIMTLIVGGVETTSSTLTWAISLLLNNPHVIKKAKEEIDIQVGNERCVEVSDIESLVYLQSIVKETLRLYPPVPLSGPREFSEDCNLGGYAVKKGTRLILNLTKIHTDPQVWLDPLEFKPERFLTTHKHIDVKGRNFKLLPFGGGRRICPGLPLGLQMVQLALASFLHSFEISNPSTKPIDMTESFGLTNNKATPLEILIKPLSSSSYYEKM